MYEFTTWPLQTYMKGLTRIFRWSCFIGTLKAEEAGALVNEIQFFLAQGIGAVKTDVQMFRRGIFQMYSWIEDTALASAPHVILTTTRPVTPGGGAHSGWHRTIPPSEDGMTPANTLVALWSYVTSLWVLRGSPPRAFYFKYNKAPDAPITTEDHADGRLEMELTDFTHNVPRRLEMSTLRGVGRLIYRTGLPGTTSTFETNTDTTSDNAETPIASPVPHPEVHQSPLPNEGTHGTHRSPPRASHAPGYNTAPSSPPGQQSGGSYGTAARSG
ncbi:hypothetical protein BKA70DRAFT_1234987 [Coprinopsis sp. MPI-PUGE-AT-0042]|nr:hypothetical protein BKA70DRAFT_1234987 [Coprinopsis sp. MPI-PUGE-AT-0042]